MGYLVLGCEIEYELAAKRLEELAYVQPGTLEAQERKELLNLFVKFERDMSVMSRNYALSHNTSLYNPKS